MSAILAWHVDRMLLHWKQETDSVVMRMTWGVAPKMFVAYAEPLVGFLKAADKAGTAYELG